MEFFLVGVEFGDFTRRKTNHLLRGGHAAAVTMRSVYELKYAVTLVLDLLLLNSHCQQNFRCGKQSNSRFDSYVFQQTELHISGFPQQYCPVTPVLLL